MGGNNPADNKSQVPTPTFPSAGIPSPQTQVIQPNNPQFYDGSITQVLKNPLPNAGIPMPSNSFPLLGLPPQQVAPSPVPMHPTPVNNIASVLNTQVAAQNAQKFAQVPQAQPPMPKGSFNFL